MSSFNVVSTLEVMNEAEASELLSTVSSLFNEEVSVEHGVSIDAVQLIELAGGKATFLGVFGAAYKKALETNDYSVGRIFDAFDDDQLKYGQHVAEVGKRIRAGESISSAMKYANKHLMVRRQIQINSVVKVDGAGRQYVNYMYRDINVSNGVIGPWKSTGAKNRVQRALKLYIKNLEEQVFYTRENGVPTQVFLGDTFAYDKVQSAIAASGNIDAYKQVLNSMNQDVLDDLAEDQQVLFLNVYSAVIKK
jgi:hypothetical protein